MLVLAAVPAEQCHKLRRAAAPRFPVVHARDWDDALAIIRTRPVELAAVDPQLEGSPSAREIERLRVLFPSLPLILYTALTPATAAVLLALGHSGINAVVFTRIDDHPARLREVLAHEEARSASRQLLDQLAAVLAPLPSELRWVVEEVLRAPAELQTVQQVAARARVDRRTFERWFARLQLPSPRHFLAAARVLYAHRLLQDPGFTIDDVAQRLGYAQTKTLQLHARSYLGLTAGEMRLTLEPREALERIAQGFAPLRQAHASASSAARPPIHRRLLPDPPPSSLWRTTRRCDACWSARWSARATGCWPPPRPRRHTSCSPPSPPMPCCSTSSSPPCRDWRSTSPSFTATPRSPGASPS